MTYSIVLVSTAHATLVFQKIFFAQQSPTENNFSYFESQFWPLFFYRYLATLKNANLIHLLDGLQLSKIERGKYIFRVRRREKIRDSDEKNRRIFFFLNIADIFPTTKKRDTRDIRQNQRQIWSKNYPDKQQAKTRHLKVFSKFGKNWNYIQLCKHPFEYLKFLHAIALQSSFSFNGI